jgi:hypothetical protein
MSRKLYSISRGVEPLCIGLLEGEVSGQSPFDQWKEISISYAVSSTPRACQTEQQLQGRADQMILPTSLLDHLLHMNSTCCKQPSAPTHLVAVTVADQELWEREVWTVIQEEWKAGWLHHFRPLDLFLYILEHMFVVTAALVSTYVKVWFPRLDKRRSAQTQDLEPSYQTSKYYLKTITHASQILTLKLVYKQTDWVTEQLSFEENKCKASSLKRLAVKLTNYFSSEENFLFTITSGSRTTWQVLNRTSSALKIFSIWISLLEV